MDYRSLGRSGLKVSPLCLGTMMFGGATDEATAARIVARARDQGVNFIELGGCLLWRQVRGNGGEGDPGAPILVGGGN